jgi:branched-chain amino acid transport system permease protein
MSRTNLGKTIRLGLLAGLVVLSVSVIGMVEAFNERDIIVDWLTMGQVLLFGASAYVGYKAAETYAVAGQRRASPLPALLSGLLAGFISAIPLVLLVLIALSWTNIRDYLVNVSPALIDILTFGRDNLAGSLIMAAVMSVLGLLGAMT